MSRQRPDVGVETIDDATDMSPLSEDEWLDLALSQTFPASDPLPAFRGDSAPPPSACEKK